MYKTQKVIEVTKMTKIPIFSKSHENVEKKPMEEEIAVFL